MRIGSRLFLCLVVATCIGTFAAAARAQHSKPGEATGFSTLMKQSMERMHHGMTAEPASGDPDGVFVRMMIPHHQGAIDMSKALLLYGKDRELQQLAKSIIAEQQNEIQLMQLWLAKQPSSAKPNHPEKPEKD